MPEQTGYLYYSIRRPVDIGTYPRDPEPLEIVNYDDGRIPVEDGAFSAWGHLVYEAPLSPEDVAAYELRPAPFNPPPDKDGPQRDAPAVPETETYSQAGNTFGAQAPAMTAADVPAIADALAGSSITADEVDAVLRDGGNDRNTLLRITAYYMKDKPLTDNVDFLRREHVARYREKDVRESGKGFQFGNEKLSVWFDGDGITLGRGDTALRASDRVHLTWEQAAVRVRELLDAGEYVNGDVFDEAISNEHRELADRLLHFYRDDLSGFRERPEEWIADKGGWPEDVEKTKALLDNPEEYGKILSRLEGDVAALQTDPEAPTRFWHSPSRMLQDVRNGAIAPISYPHTDHRPPSSMRFITQDEIDAYFTRGSDYHFGCHRILSYFLHDHTPKERAAFVKNEYGHGGHSHALGGADDSWADYEPGKGIVLRRGGLGDEAYDTVKLTWSAAQKRIMGLINEGSYMTRRGLDRIHEFETDMLARYATSFFYGVPAEERPYPSVNEFNNETDQNTVRELLNDPEQVDAILAAMRPIMAATAEGDRYYELRRNGLDNLTAYRDGTFDLFPGIDALPQPETVAPLPRKRVEQAPEQLTLFSQEPAPALRGVEEQQARIEQAVIAAEREAELPATDIISQYEIDVLLRGAVKTTEQHEAILAAFSSNPRSREAVGLIKDVYSKAIYYAERIDGTGGYMGLTGDAAGVIMAKRGPQSAPKDEGEPFITIDLSWPKVHRRVSELVAAGEFVFQHTPEPDVPAPDGLEIAATEPEVDVTLETKPAPRMYEVGDTVYYDGGEYTITDIGDRVNLDLAAGQDTATQPIKQSTSRVNFETGLTADPRNRRFTEHLTRGADLDNADDDLTDVLENGLLSASLQSDITEYLADGNPTNSHLASFLSAMVPRDTGTMTLEDGYTADFTASLGGLTIEILDKYDTTRGYSWEELAPVVRALNARGWRQAELAVEPDAAMEPPLTAAEPDAPEQAASARPYAQGDTVYLANEREVVVEWIGYHEVSFHDTSQPAGISKLMEAEDFERELRENPRNRHLFETVAEQEAELDFEAAAQMTLTRVMENEGYLADLMAAPSRASLRNPCTRALEKVIRDHEQDEPALFHRYFFDDDWNDRLFGYVLRESFALRPQPEIVPEAVTPQPAPEVEPEDDFSDIDVAAIRERLQNPTPEDEARLNDMLAFAEQAAADFDADLGITATGADTLEALAHDVTELFGEADDSATLDSVNDGYDLERELLQQFRTGDFAQAEELLHSVSRFKTHDADLEVQAAALLDRLHAFAEQSPRSPQDIVDAALREWNGSLDSKVLVYQYMREHDRERDTAAFLRTEYGEYAEGGADPSTFAVAMPDGDTELLSWPKVQRRLAQLIEQGAFLSPDELEYVEREYDFPDAYDGPTADELIRSSIQDGLDLLDPEDADESEVAQTGEMTHMPFDMTPETDSPAAKIPAEPAVPSTPPPVFFPNWEAAQHDFDLSRYNDGDTIGYDKEGVKYEVGRTESTTYVTQTGLFWGGNEVPGDIYEQIQAYLAGDLTDEQARDNYLKIISPEPPAADEPLPPAPNYRITDDQLGAGGPKTRFAANIAAIRTLQQIEAESRHATRPEQEVLARYVGWGGLDKAFDDSAEGWQNEYIELKRLLTPEEYDKARSSVLNAHYTPPVVIRAIYDAIGQMGFKRGNVLEPSCGIGHFFGLVPEDMQGAKLYGVELDDISARIAEKLYPSAAIMNRGFEKTNFPDSFFDVVVGNVPFGDYKVYDQNYNRNNFMIHDYFVAKSIDKVRAGGVVALVTSGGTLDKLDSKARRYMAERCDLIGAVRLPDSTFKAAAGAEITTDILFLQKREVPRDLSVEMPDWVGVSVVHEHQHEYENGEVRNNNLTLNNYYQEHPEMVLGKLEVESGPFGPQLSCKPDGSELADRLREAVSHLQADMTVAEPTLDDLADTADEGILADPNVRNFSYTLVDDRVFYRENSMMYPVELPATTLERIRGMVELRDCVHTLIDLQLNDYDDHAIHAQQQRLDTLYDAFVADYGLINSVGNSRAFSGDSAYYLLCSLEILDEDGNLERKADMFTKRTIKQRTVITSVDTASEALAVSIGERARVDLDYMSELSGLSHDRLIEDLRGVIYLNVGSAESQDKAYVTADEYLSGNIRKKLESARAAAAVMPSLAINVEALEQAMPKDLEASEIAVRLGSTWVDKSYVQQFMYELLQTSYNLKNVCKVNYTDFTGEWQITGKSKVPYSNIPANVTYGTGRRNAYEIIEDTLNLRDVRVYDTVTEDGKEKRVLNRKETTLAQQKQEQIKQAFKDWIWDDPQRRQTLVRKYNDLFNSSRPREYDGSHIVFSGMNPEYTLRPYQANAIARVLYGGNTLLAHEVGAGKTFEMVAAAMEGKRLGLCNKSMFAVPNHIIDQIASDFLRLYPSANILVAQKKDFEMRNRKKFCAKIATGDYDAVIIGHSQLEKIPISKDRQERLLQEQLSEVIEGIEEVSRSRGERFTVKQLERTKKRLEARLEKVRAGKGRDDVVTFEQLGVDRIFVDEAHNYKNLFLYTKMRNVAGLSTTDAQKSNDLFLKCRYMDELTDGKGVIFATGTPVSNSMTELYTMQRYLQYEELERRGLIHFDSWASTFGETVTAMELAPEGTGYRARTRFSRFHNLPELMNMFSEIADIKTADSLDLVRPNAHYETVVVKPSELQQEMVQSLSERAAAVHTGRVDPKVDNMLKITSDGRKIGLDQRLINPLLPDDPGSKVNACMENITRIWAQTKNDRLAQLVFCDFSTPNKDGRFNVYDDIRAKLVEKGIPEHEIAFIHDANTDARKKELFAKVRKGQVRVLFGSTFKMGAGTNVQDKLIAMHDLDCPWRPADLEQRAGRIVRFGNQNPDVFINRYVTEGTFDAYLWQTVENKQKFISQIMTSKSPVRSCEDVDETSLSYAEIKALCSGNPLIKEKIDLDIEVSRLRLLKSEHQSQHHRLEDNLLDTYPKSIKATQENIAGLERDMVRLKANLPKEPPASAEPVVADGAGEGEAAAKPEAAKAPFPPMTVMGTVYTEKAAAGEALLEACKSVKDIQAVPVGSYLGFDVSMNFNAVTKKYGLTLKGDMSYSVEMGIDAFGNINRMNNALKSDMPQRLESSRTQLENLHQQVEDAKQELLKPFGMEKELAEKEMRLALVNAELNIEDGPAPMEAAAMMNEAASFKEKPSILDGLRARHEADKPSLRPDKAAGPEITM